MNAELQGALAALAVKLGTTVEHLWGVLIRQAPISAATDLLAVAASAALLYFGWRAIDRVQVRGDFDVREFALMMGYIGLMLAAVGVSVVFVSSLSHIVAGFVNPEYWALREIRGIVGK